MKNSEILNEIKKVACIGGGTIGAGWATTFAMNGLDLDVNTRSDKTLKAAEEAILQNLELLAEKDMLEKDSISGIMAKISYETDVKKAVTGADFIQENGPESYELKEAILAEIESTAKPDAIIASSTSGLLITRMAEKMEHPERIVGGHPYNPVHLMPLIEVSKGEKTDESAVQKAYDLYAAVGKEPVVVKKETPGFIANRLQVALYREAIDLVMRGVCSVEDVDKATTFGLGVRFAVMGPNLIFHLGAGDQGIRGLLTKLHDSTADRMKDMANWTEEPIEWPEVAEEGVLEEIENRPASQGKTIPELKRFRDDMLIDVLKLHKNRG